MEVLRLSAEECGLLAARFAEHGNSHRRMAAALREAGAGAALERLQLLRRLEVRFSIDLGSLCHHFLRERDGTPHPLERVVLSYVAEWSPSHAEGEELCVWVDRVRQVQEWIEEGELAPEPES